MAQVRDVLSHVAVEEAQRPRICHRNRKKHSIAAGESCLVVSDENGGAKNYCAVCASEILKSAQRKLLAAAAALGVSVADR